MCPRVGTTWVSNLDGPVMAGIARSPLAKIIRNLDRIVV